jgi:uroporphyrinogen-III synthase
MTKNILLTRSIENSLPLAHDLELQGFRVFCQPLFNVKAIKNAAFKKKPPFLIVTSSNSCDILSNLTLEKNIKIYSVGKKTAQNLEKLGFNNIEIPKENSASALKKLIINKEKARDGLYLRGEIITLDFAKELAKKGFHIEDLITYQTIEASNFSEELLQFCQNNQFESVLIFSKNSAKIFFNLAQKHNLLEYFNKSQILCFSQKILDEVKNLGFKKAAIFT